MASDTDKPQRRGSRLNYAVITVCLSCVILGGFVVWAASWVSVRPSSVVTQKPRIAVPRIGSDNIPTIIHQTWKYQKLPENYAEWSETWKENHPDWQYRLWTDKDNREFVAKEFPWFLNIYEKLPATIMQVDCVRYLYMYKFGGMYADMDFVSLKPMDKLLEDAEVVLGFMTGSNWMSANSIPNAWMASRPGHPFWMYVISQIIEALLDKEKRMSAEAATGTILLTRSVLEYKKKHGSDSITVLDPGMVYPINWHLQTKDCSACCYGPGFDFDYKKCNAMYPDAYAITYWFQTWSQPDGTYGRYAGTI